MNKNLNTFRLDFAMIELILAIIVFRIGNGEILYTFFAGCGILFSFLTFLSYWKGKK